MKKQIGKGMGRKSHLGFCVLRVGDEEDKLSTGQKMSVTPVYVGKISLAFYIQRITIYDEVVLILLFVGSLTKTKTKIVGSFCFCKIIADLL